MPIRSNRPSANPVHDALGSFDQPQYYHYREYLKLLQPTVQYPADLKTIHISQYNIRVKTTPAHPVQESKSYHNSRPEPCYQQQCLAAIMVP